MNTMIKLALIAELACFATAATAENLLHDGGFESPAVPAGSYTIFGVGQNIGPWRVVGNNPSAQDVSLVSGTYSENGITFNAHHHNQYLDLSNFRIGCGASSSQGVSRTVALVPGSPYVLSFWLGSGYDVSGDNCTGTMSRADVFVDGVLLMSAIQPGNENSTTQAWKRFTVTFTATTNMTSITFMMPTWQVSNVGLDDVELISAPPT